MRSLTGGQTDVEHVLSISAGGKSIGQIARSKSVTGALSERASYYSADHLGSVRAVVDSTGQVQRKTTDPFGNAVVNPLEPHIRHGATGDDTHRGAGERWFHGA